MGVSETKCVNKVVILILTLIFGVIVVYQGLRCIMKLNSNLQTMESTYYLTTKVDFPSLTFCPREDNGWKDDEKIQFSPQPYKSWHVKDCGYSKVSDYTAEGHWIGIEKNGSQLDDYCNDPKKFHLKIINDFKDLGIKSVTVSLYLTSEKLEYSGKKISEKFQCNQTGDLVVSDSKRGPKSGNCFTFSLPEDLIEQGIESISFYGEDDTKLWLNLHKQGDFGSDLPLASFPMVLGPEKASYKIEHEIFNHLDYDKEDCNSNTDYSFDACREEFIFNQSMSKFNCTTPFGPDIDFICTDHNISLAALDYRQQVLKMGTKDCPYPCKSMKINVVGSKTVDEKSKQIFNPTFQFGKYITVTTSSWSYQELEFLGEFGGLAGLFLGISFMDIGIIFKKFVNLF